MNLLERLYWSPVIITLHPLMIRRSRNRLFISVCIWRNYVVRRRIREEVFFFLFFLRISNYNWAFVLRKRLRLWRPVQRAQVARVVVRRCESEDNVTDCSLLLYSIIFICLVYFFFGSVYIFTPRNECFIIPLTVWLNSRVKVFLGAVTLLVPKFGTVVQMERRTATFILYHILYLLRACSSLDHGLGFDTWRIIV